MTTSEFIKTFGELTDAMNNKVVRKNADYTGGNNDAFACFRGYEACGVSIEQGIMTRLCDKHSRACGLIAGHRAEVTDEALDDTLMDMATYALILLAYRQSKKAQASL